MAKKKSSKKSDQPELPLDAAPTAAPAGDKDAGSTAKSEVTSPNSDLRSSISDSAPAESPPPPRKKGEKVQDDQAPLAQHYRNWFLDYASYVILDRAVP